MPETQEHENQLMITPADWGKTARESVEFLLNAEPSNKQKETLESMVAQWVFDIREDEIKEIIEEVQALEEKATASEVLNLLSARLPKRPFA